MTVETQIKPAPPATTSPGTAGGPSLARLLRPRSVVIVGASDKPGALGASVLSNLTRNGFAGDIHLINPKRPEIAGRPCLPSVDALPEGVDAAVLAIPRVAVLDTIRALAARKVGAAVIFSAGFAEGGAEGLAQQHEIGRIAAASGMVIEGPNCLGMTNFIDRVPLTFVEMDAVPLGSRDGIGIVSQSGAMAAVLSTTLMSRDLGLSFSVSTGNEAASGVEDYVDYLIDDAFTQVIAMIVEQFRKPKRFIDAALRAQEAGKTIVLLHPGKSSAARESAATHTGAMAGTRGHRSAISEISPSSSSVSAKMTPAVSRCWASRAPSRRSPWICARRSSLNCRLPAMKILRHCVRRCRTSSAFPTRSTLQRKAWSIPISIIARLPRCSRTTVSAASSRASSRPIR